MEFGYWGIQGLGQSIRYLLISADADYKETSFNDFESWFGKAKPELQKETPFANLPYLKDDGKVITQSGAILRYLGCKLGYTGKDAQAKIDSEVVFGVLQDLWSKVVKLIFNKEQYEDNKSKAHDEILALLTNINTHLEGRKFVAGDSLVWTDFFLYYVFTIFTRYSSKIAALSNANRYMADFNTAAGDKFVAHFEKIKGVQPVFPPGMTAFKDDHITLDSFVQEF